MKELESSLAQKEDLIRGMENSIQEQGITIRRLQSEIKVLNDQLSCEERKIKSLEREGDRLRAEVALLESKVRNLQPQADINSCFIFYFHFKQIYLIYDNPLQVTDF